MSALDAYLEQVWNGILSEDEGQIIETFRALSDIDRQTVVDHLQKMCTEEGWHPAQIRSASTALNIINVHFQD